MKRALYFLAALTVSILIAACAGNNAKADLAAYYTGIEGLTGQELKAKLHTIIAPHKVYPYFGDSAAVAPILAEAEADPNKPGNIILFYTGRSQPAIWMDHGYDFDYALWGVDHDDTWNREHIWAKSQGFPRKEEAAYSDLHNLRPTDRSANTLKAAKMYDWGGVPDSEAVGASTDFDSYEPRDEVKGDIARCLFYMATCYEGDNGPDLELADSLTLNAPVYARLSTILAWHKQDPPDDYERRRHEVIYKWQGNRNPYIDHPEFVEQIWNQIDTSAFIRRPIDKIHFSTTTPGNTSGIINVPIFADNLTDEIKLMVPPWVRLSYQGQPADYYLMPENGQVRKVLQLSFMPDQPKVYTGMLQISSPGANTIGVPLLGRCASADEQVILAAPFDTTLAGWTTTTTAGKVKWELSAYSDRRFVKVSGRSNQPASTCWLISKPIDLRLWDNPLLSFETAKNKWDEIPGLEVYLLFDYTPTNLENCHKTKLNPKLSAGKWQWTQSGWIDLTGWEREVNIAFVYSSSGKGSTSWELDNLRLTGVPR